MDPRFNTIEQHPANQVFHVVFFPDRVYHAQYLNATRSPRYRYDVTEVRSKTDAMVMKGVVFLDDRKLTHFIRIEYRAGRLTEVSRLQQRLVGCEVVAWIKLMPRGGAEVDGRVVLGYCPWVDAYQCEIWQSLEAPDGSYHDFKVTDQMGRHGTITRLPAFSPVLENLADIRKVQLAFREGRTKFPSGYGISDEQSAWDNFYGRNLQQPNSPVPNDHANNTVPMANYEIDFQRGWYFADIRQVQPVRYRNAMIVGEPALKTIADTFFGGDRARMDDQNIVEMRWALQNELGSNLVFFHEVTVPPGGVEGTHQHIGSEELYFITEGSGIAYMSVKDDPAVTADENLPTVTMPIFGLDPRPMKELPVKPGSIIFTKSGGMHGIRNPNAEPLRFVAFLYHAQ
jgi:mannose-6-phosphate isomerase-like protein (cupin superfamily)